MNDLLMKYDLEYLGKGGHSIVYKAVNKITKEEYALKLVKKRDEEKDSMVIKEILLHSKLNHPNIIKLINSFEDDENFYIF